MESAEAPQGLNMLAFGVVWAADCVGKAAICPVHQLSPAHTGSHGGLAVVKWLNGDTERWRRGG